MGRSRRAVRILGSEVEPAEKWLSYLTKVIENKNNANGNLQRSLNKGFVLENQNSCHRDISEEGRKIVTAIIFCTG
jgi:hypothetical protein